MPAEKVHCARLKRELPGIDPGSAEGGRAMRLALLIGGPELQERVRREVSQEAWNQWTDHMRMVINEYRIDPTSDAANAQLRPHLEAFLFGGEARVDNWTPPE